MAISDKDLCRVRDPGGGVRCDLDRDEERFCKLEDRDAFNPAVNKHAVIV